MYISQSLRLLSGFTKLLLQQVSHEVAIKELSAKVDREQKTSREYKIWSREANALHKIGKFKHQNIVETFAIFNHINTEYFMFPWANGGNLMEFLQRSKNSEMNRDSSFVKEIVTQIEGLASAIETIHKGGFRHGDLKPQNILVFNKEKGVGIWKIADMGLAKFHNSVTGARKGPTTMLGQGTLSYEPPETATTTGRESARSRLYDIWSMGCIIVQIVVLLLHGEKAFLALGKKTESRMTPFNSSFWEGNWDNKHGWKDVKVHEEVLKVIDKMEEDFRSARGSDRIGTRALIDLAKLARSRLLVVSVPKFWDNLLTPGDHRATAKDLHVKTSELRLKLEQEIDSSSSNPTRSPPTRAAPTRPANSQLQPPQQIHSDRTDGSHVSQPLSHSHNRILCLCVSSPPYGTTELNERSLAKII